MTNHLRLEDIDTEDLSTNVSASGLVSTEQVCNAYKAQALRAQKMLRTVHEQLRVGYGTWESSGTTVVAYDDNRDLLYQTEILSCPILKSGIHKWSIKILEYHQTLGIGVVSTCQPVDPDEFVANQQVGWCLVTNGSDMHAYSYWDRKCSIGVPKFSEGCTVSFTLDLEGEGILKASIDGGALFELFTGMITEGDDNSGFVPAATLFPSSRIEFLGFDE